MTASDMRPIKPLVAATTIYLVMLVACTLSPTKETYVPGTESGTVVSATGDLPNYLGNVWPHPDSTLSLDEYNQSLERFSFLDGNIGVGVELLAYSVAEKGDFDINWMQRSSLFVDGLSVQGYTGEFADGAVLREGYNEQGTPTYRVGGPYYMAWHVPLEPGEHEAIFKVRKTSGVVLEYSWYFSIIP